MFETLKTKLQKRIERNCVKSELNGEVVYLKKGSIFAPIPGLGKRMCEWGQIYPPVNEDGTWNIVNLLFGGKRNIVKLIIIFIIVAMVIMQFMDNYNLLGQAVECCNRCNSINLVDLFGN